jgi:hypothetical protein
VRIEWDNTLIHVCDTQMQYLNYSYYSASGWNGNTTGTNNYGIIADISIRCDADELMCILAKEMRFPILWKWGANLMHAGLFTERLNYFTLTFNQYSDREQYYNKKYETALEALLKSIPQLLCNIDKYCIQCNATQYVEITP